MRITMICEEARKVGERRYLNKFRPFPTYPSSTLIEVEADGPAVPGEAYHLMLSGKFPTWNQINCVGDILSFKCLETLTAVDLKDEMRAGLHGEHNKIP